MSKEQRRFDDPFGSCEMSEELAWGLDDSFRDGHHMYQVDDNIWNSGEFDAKDASRGSNGAAAAAILGGSLNTIETNVSSRMFEYTNKANELPENVQADNQRKKVVSMGSFSTISGQSSSNFTTTKKNVTPHFSLDALLKRRREEKGASVSASRAASHQEQQEAQPTAELRRQVSNNMDMDGSPSHGNAPVTKAMTQTYQDVSHMMNSSTFARGLLSIEDYLKNDRNLLSKIANDIQVPPGGALHVVCASPNFSWSDRITLTKVILKTDPMSASRPLTLHKVKKSKSIYGFNRATNRVEMHTPSSASETIALPFQYPINLAIACCGSYKTEQREDKKVFLKILLDNLAEADPTVICRPDGPKNHSITTLHLMLKAFPNSIELVDTLLLRNPGSANLNDSKGNTPLHTLVQHATNQGQGYIEVAKHLYVMAPHTLHKTNLHGVTPLLAAQRRTDCPEAIALYLLEKQHGSGYS